MGKLRDSVLILGEGPTEFYYFNSLCELLKGVTIKPDYPKHTNIKELGCKIAEGIEQGYGHIFCVIDMDNKLNEPERTQYNQLKTKYSNPVSKPRKGINCEVRFFETHRCTELFFLYYFCYTSRMYDNQDSLIKDLNAKINANAKVNAKLEYQKTIDFFRKSNGLHSYFLKNGGCFEMAIQNSNLSAKEKMSGIRDYTYSELGNMMTRLMDMKLAMEDSEVK